MYRVEIELDSNSTPTEWRELGVYETASQIRNMLHNHAHNPAHYGKSIRITRIADEQVMQWTRDGELVVYDDLVILNDTPESERF